jgi:hypothetical protein
MSGLRAEKTVIAQIAIRDAYLKNRQQAKTQANGGQRTPHYVKQK